MGNWTLRVVWVNLGLNVLNSVALSYYIIKMRQYKHPADRTQEVLDAISAERRHFGNIESFWNTKWRALRHELEDLQAKIKRFFHGSAH